MRRYLYSVCVDKGLARANNEDNIFVCGKFLSPDIRNNHYKCHGLTDAPNVFAVCDGVGGEENGEIASLTAVNTLCRHHNSLISASRAKFESAAAAFMKNANDEIAESNRQTGKRSGTTAALIAIIADKVFAVNIGDSRVYRFRKNKLKQLSVDHISYLNGKKKLTQCLGAFGSDFQIAPYFSPILKSKKGDIFLICSDGLTDMVEETQISEFLQQNGNIENAAGILVDAALKNGGKDNIAVIVITFTE
jgi:protein phosphatase